MIGTGAAILGAALIGGGVSLYGANKAANAQTNAANNALAFQQGVYNDNKGNLAPWIESGRGANNLLSSFYGLNGDPALGNNALARFAESPDYKFAFSEGMRGLENSAAARGGLLSGNAMRGITEFGQGLASNNLGNYLTRISGISNQGLTAANALAGNGATMGSQIGGSFGNLGKAEASGYVGSANAINGGLNNLLFYNQFANNGANNLRQSSYSAAPPTFDGNQLGRLY